MSYIDSDFFICFLPSLAVFCCISLDFHGSLFCHFFILTDLSHPLINETCLLPCFGGNCMDPNWFQIYSETVMSDYMPSVL